MCDTSKDGLFGLFYLIFSFCSSQLSPPRRVFPFPFALLHSFSPCIFQLSLLESDMHSRLHNTTLFGLVCFILIARVTAFGAFTWGPGISTVLFLYSLLTSILIQIKDCSETMRTICYARYSTSRRNSQSSVLCHLIRAWR